jgi:hypothetical protein
MLPSTGMDLGCAYQALCHGIDADGSGISTSNVSDTSVILSLQYMRRSLALKKGTTLEFAARNSAQFFGGTPSSGPPVRGLCNGSVCPEESQVDASGEDAMEALKEVVMLLR